MNISDEQLKNALSAVFKKYDKNNSGALDIAEVI